MPLRSPLGTISEAALISYLIGDIYAPALPEREFTLRNVIVGIRGFK